MTTVPFPRPVTGMTLDEIRRALEDISGECRATAGELNGSDAAHVRRMLIGIALLVESAHALVLNLSERKG